MAAFSVNIIACVKSTCVLGLSSGTALGFGFGIDEFLMNNGPDPVFKNTIGKGLDKSLDRLGFKNPNKDISSSDSDLKLLKYRYNKLTELNKDIDELKSVGEYNVLENYEFICEVKKNMLKKEYNKRNH